MKQKAISLNPPSPRFAKIAKVSIEVIIAILVVVWLNTGVSKLIEYQSFRLQLAISPLFSNHVKIIAFTGPFLEIVLAALLIIKRTRLIGMIGSFLLMFFFSGYVLYLMITMPHLPCSCGGITKYLNWPQHLALNLFLTIIALVGIFLLRNLRKSQSTLH